MTKALKQIRVEGNIAYVPLTRGYEAVIDATDAEFVGQWSWYSIIDIHTVYAARTDRSGDKRRMVYLHRLLAGVSVNEEADHIDGDGLNNRRGNLRHATPSQNKCNQSIRSDNKSGYKGVYWHKGKQKWTSKIGLNGKRVYLGYYSTPEDAAVAYAEASAKYHGEYGRTE